MSHASTSRAISSARQDTDNVIILCSADIAF
jgi:hypothetical protein